MHGAVPLGRGHDATQLHHVLGRTGKTERYPIDAKADRKGRVGAVLIGQERESAATCTER